MEKDEKSRAGIVVLMYAITFGFFVYVLLTVVVSKWT